MYILGIIYISNIYYVSHDIFSSSHIAIHGTINLSRDKLLRMHYKRKLCSHILTHLSSVLSLASEVTAKDSSSFLKSRS